MEYLTALSKVEAMVVLMAERLGGSLAASKDERLAVRTGYAMVCWSAGMMVF